MIEAVRIIKKKILSSGHSGAHLILLVQESERQEDHTFEATMS